MTTNKLLQECLDALNQIPNTKLKGKYKNSYQLAEAIGKFYRDSETEAIHDNMGSYLSNDANDFPKLEKLLRSALIANGDMLIDNIKGFEVWEPVKYKFTVGYFCQLVGIK